MLKTLRKYYKTLPVPVRRAVSTVVHWRNVIIFEVRKFWRERPVRRVDKLVSKHFNSIVQDGPFKGMKYVANSVHSGYSSKIIGCYEVELHSTIEQLIARKYKNIINIGAAEGYYSVGMALRCPYAKVISFEATKRGRQLCQELAKNNGVEDRVLIHGYCDSHALNQLPVRASLIICDIEGYEFDLIDPEKVPDLREADLVVELHDCYVPNVTQAILDRFAHTHASVLFTARTHNPQDFSQSLFLPAEQAQIAVDDQRGFPDMQWIFLERKSKAY